MANNSQGGNKAGRESQGERQLGIAHDGESLWCVRRNESTTDAGDNDARTFNRRELIRDPR
jgi:hypothetical protein